MKYKIGERVQRDKRNLKKYIVGGVVSILVAGGMAIPAFAANDYCGTSPTAPGNGPSNGCAQSFSNTQCAGHGSFGAFGTDNSFAGGASGDRTAYANSGLCG